MFNVHMTPCLGVPVTPILEFFTRGGFGIAEPFVTLTSAPPPKNPSDVRGWVSFSRGKTFLSLVSYVGVAS